MDFAREPRRAQDAQSSSAAAQRVGNTSQLVSLRSKAVPFETGRFRRADRILCSRDFEHAVKSGKRGASKNFVVAVAPRVDGDARETDEIRSRLGVTVSKRVGNSVIRNRVKRRIREWFRHARESLPDGSDTVVIARRRAKNLSSCEVAAILDGMIQGVRARQRSPAKAES